MNMKKRSQSSLRSKTLQSEDDHHEPNYWIGSLHNKKLPTKFASSMIEANKQNESMNVDCRSASQSVNESYVNCTPVSHKNKESHLAQHDCQYKQRCKNLQKQLSALYGEISKRSENSPVGKLHTPISERNEQQYDSNGPYNYMERYYQVEIQSLKCQISEMSSELKKYHELYSSTKTEFEGLSQGISERIERQNNEKNVLIKEINTNNIEIKRLKQEIVLHRSEKEAIRMMLEEKENMISQLKGEIINVDLKRKKIENYELKLNESNNLLKEIEIQVAKYKGELEKKEAIVSSNNTKIGALEGRILEYQEEMKKLGDFVICLKESTMEGERGRQEIVDECQQWKNRYCQIKEQIEQIPQFEIKMKNLQSNVEDMQCRNRELVSANEKLKVDLGGYQLAKAKVTELQKQLGSLRKMLRQKCDELECIQNNQRLQHGVSQEIQLLRSKMVEIQRAYEDKQKQIRMLQLKEKQKDQKINQLYDELEESGRERIRIKQLQQKIDTLFSQNQKLHCSLLEKVAEIEDLQRKLNFVESKNVGLTNEYAKIKAVSEGLCQQLKESGDRYEEVKDQLESEMMARQRLQQRFEGAVKQNGGLLKQIERLGETNVEIKEREEKARLDHETLKKQYNSQVTQLRRQKEKAEQKLLNSSRRIEQLYFDSKELKHKISIQIHKQEENLHCIQRLQDYIIKVEGELKVAQVKYAEMRRCLQGIQDMSAIGLQEK